MIPYARNVDKMVDAYSGNPQALMDKYAKDPQIAYLIALGEVKKRRQDLERQRAMQQPQQMPTVMQSLEQEAGLPPSGQPAGGVDQRQVAQNVGGVLNFQQQKQQEALKKLVASGIAGAPGSQNVMPPKAMAAGGIVAFQSGGRVVNPAEVQSHPTYIELRRQGVPAKDAYERVLHILSQTDPPKLEPRPLGSLSPSLDIERKDPSNLPAVQGSADVSYVQPLPEARIISSDTGAQSGAVPAQKTPPPPPPAPTAPAEPPRAPLPVQPGIAGLSQAMQGLGEDTATAARRMIRQDPRAMAQEQERRYEERMALTPEQRGTYKQYQKDLEKFYADRARQQREDEITSGLIGAAGKSTLGLTGAGFAAGAMGARQRAAGEQLKGIEALGKARTGLVDIERANIKDALGAGSKEREQAGLEGRQGLESGSRLYGTGVQAEIERQRMAQTGQIEERKLTSAALDRQLQNSIRQAQVEGNRLAAEGRSQAQIGAVIGKMQDDLRDYEKDLRASFQTENLILLSKPEAKLTPAEKTQLELARATMEKKLKEARAQAKPVMDSLRSRLTSGWDVKPE